MQDNVFTFVIPGDPTPLARCRFGKGKFYDSQKNLKLVWGIYIKNQVTPELNKILPLHDRALFLDVVFYFKIPKTKKNVQGHYHIFRPDTSNLIKFVEDAATSVLFNDDCIIAHINAEKRYSNEPRTEFSFHIVENNES